jgi:hypothetical protein
MPVATLTMKRVSRQDNWQHVVEPGLKLYDRFRYESVFHFDKIDKWTLFHPEVV